MAKKMMAKGKMREAAMTQAPSDLKMMAESPYNGMSGGTMMVLGNDPKAKMSDMSAGEDLQKGYRSLGGGLMDGMGTMESQSKK